MQFLSDKRSGGEGKNLHPKTRNQLHGYEGALSASDTRAEGWAGVYLVHPYGFLLAPFITGWRVFRPGARNPTSEAILCYPHRDGAASGNPPPYAQVEQDILTWLLTR